MDEERATDARQAAHYNVGCGYPSPSLRSSPILEHMDRTVLWALTELVSPAMLRVMPKDPINRVQLAHSPSLNSDVDAIRLDISVAGEEFGYVIFDPATFISTKDARDRLISVLADFVAESEFGWGQKRD
jgi:hypothetical protein